MERAFDIARSSLDFFAFTPHGWWPDLPDTDPSVQAYHLRGFEKTEARWQEALALTNAGNTPGQFVSFPGYEWHSISWGDFHVIFPDGQGEVGRAETAEALYAWARERGALVIPHHPAYRLGWRGTNWSTVNDELSPVCEVFSEHGCSLETPSLWSMHGHSMGGASKEQTVLEQLRCGRVIGFTAGTDNHVGYPGSYGEGLLGVWAAELTRSAIFQALRERRTVAVTGDRIEVDFRLGDACIGQVLPADAAREGTIEVRAQEEIDYVELNRNGRPLERWSAPEPQSAAHERVLRIEWGWDGIGSKDLTLWQISGAVHDGRVLSLTPCFAGGKGKALELVNRAEPCGPHSFAIESNSSRLNNRPTQAVVLTLQAEPESRLALTVWGRNPKGDFNFEWSQRIDDLVRRDAWRSIQDRFSAPKMRVGPALDHEALHLRVAWRDSNPSPADWYFVKVVQKNRQMAWCSPIWCGRP